MSEDDGLQEVKLAKKWGDYPAGATLRVDPLRADQLSADGLLVESSAAVRARAADGPSRGRSKPRAQED